MPLGDHVDHRLRSALGLGMDDLDPPTHRVRALGLMLGRARGQADRRMHLLQNRRLYGLLLSATLSRSTTNPSVA